MVVPFSIVAFMPIHTFLPISIGIGSSIPFVRSRLFSTWPLLSIMFTPIAITQPSPMIICFRSWTYEPIQSLTAANHNLRSFSFSPEGRVERHPSVISTPRTAYKTMISDAYTPRLLPIIRDLRNTRVPSPMLTSFRCDNIDVCNLDKILLHIAATASNILMIIVISQSLLKMSRV